MGVSPIRYTLKFDVSSIKRKRHIADVPYIDVDVSAALRYEVKTECALVFPIYGTSANFGHHLYPKSAIYAALTFLLNTDLKAHGVQVYFAIGDMYADEILPYFQKASIPARCIAVFDQHHLVHQLATTAAIFCDELKAVSKFLLYRCRYVCPSSSRKPSFGSVRSVIGKLDATFLLGLLGRRG